MAPITSEADSPKILGEVDMVSKMPQVEEPDFTDVKRIGYAAVSVIGLTGLAMMGVGLSMTGLGTPAAVAVAGLAAPVLAPAVKALFWKPLGKAFSRETASVSVRDAQQLAALAPIG